MSPYTPNLMIQPSHSMRWVVVAGNCLFVPLASLHLLITIPYTPTTSDRALKLLSFTRRPLLIPKAYRSESRGVSARSLPMVWMDLRSRTGSTVRFRVSFIWRISVVNGDVIEDSLARSGFKVQKANIFELTYWTY